jgi:signal peptidase I
MSEFPQDEPGSDSFQAAVISERDASPVGRLERMFGPTGATVVEWACVVAGAVLLALVVKIFLLQAFYIPSPSMYPTLKEGDRVLVNKLSYKLHDVNRGDVVVFERPASEAPSAIPELIKRVIGLPGDSVTFRNGQVYINGELLDEPYLPAGVTTTADFAPNRCTPDAPCLIPQGDVWVMGDNRNDSKDSRYFGPIPESSIVGRAFVIVWPFNRAAWL